MEMSGQSHAEATFPIAKQLVLPVKQVAGLALKKVWILRKLEKTLAFTWKGTTIPPLPKL
jgi:hypothetical protein